MKSCLWISFTVFVIVNFILIKALKPDGHLRANTKRFTWSDEHVYPFNDKEGVNFYCFTNNGSWAQLSFKTFAGQSLEASRQSKRTTMYLLLDRNRDGTVVTCTVTGKDNKQTPLRITVKLLLNRNENLLAYKVNNMIPPLILETANRTVYEYKYYNLEKLTFYLVNDNIHFKRLCNVHGPNIPQDPKISKIIKTALENRQGVDLKLLREHTNTSVTCTVTHTHERNSKQVTVQFTHQKPVVGKHLEIISFSDTIIKYWSGPTLTVKYKTPSTVGYHPDSRHGLSIAVPVILVTLLLTVLLWLAYKYCSKIQKQRKLETDCQNLSEDLEDSATGEHEAATGADCQYTYSIPLPKLNRSRNHPTKTISESTNETYDNITNKQLSEPNYSTLNNRECNYAVLDLPNSNSSNFVSTVEPNYATIQQDMAHALSNKLNSHIFSGNNTSSESYVKLQEMKKDGGYENKIAIDELEPTYCELK